MNTIYEMPPMLSGRTEDQIRQLRDYLVRLAKELPREEQIEQTVQQVVQTRARGGGAGKNQGWQEQAQALKSLIVKTADRVYETIDVLETNLSSVYVAQSDFGVYQERVDTQIRQTAKETVESYGYQAQINAVTDGLSGLAQYLTQINGEIRRGMVTDPETQETVLGIAISQNLSFTGNTVTEAGFTYYELSPGQTLGLYTSTGWQFWINGSKRGWFDSNDGMLHVARIVAEEQLQISDSWQITAAGGFGIRYIGG